MPHNRSRSISTTRSMLWMPAPSICVSRSFLGRRFARPRPPSSCTRCWTARQIPSFLHISDGKLHDVNVLDLLLPEPGAFYIMDRGNIDFDRLYQLHEAKCFFVTRPSPTSKPRERLSSIIKHDCIFNIAYIRVLIFSIGTNPRKPWLMMKPFFGSNTLKLDSK